MKILLCSLALLSPLTASAGQENVTVSLEVPKPNWSLSIVSMHTKDRKLLIICRASQKEGMAAAVISKAEAIAPLDKAYLDLPREVFVLGKTWNYGKHATALTDAQLPELLKGSKTVYLKKKKVAPEDLIGLSMEEVAKLAKENELVYRIVEVDGVARPTTMDIRPERYNLSIKDDKVVRVTKG